MALKVTTKFCSFIFFYFLYMTNIVLASERYKHWDEENDPVQRSQHESNDPLKKVILTSIAASSGDNLGQPTITITSGNNSAANSFSEREKIYQDAHK